VRQGLEQARPAAHARRAGGPHLAERQAEEVDRQWRLRLDQARYQAQLAERRYKAVDPDHRVVARSLERDWEEALRTLSELEQEHEEVRRREKVELDDADRTRILALARDLPRVWHSETTTNAQRKNLLRMLVEEVTLTPLDEPELMTRVQVLWSTGAVSEFEVPRAGRSRGTATSPATVEVLRELFEAGSGDPEIATELNRRGLRTGADRPWEEASVRRIRYAMDWHREATRSRRAPDRNEDGLYSIRGVAAELDVIPGAVYHWVLRGLLVPTVRGGPGRPHWFELDPATMERLQKAKRDYEQTGGRRRNPTRVSR